MQSGHLCNLGPVETELHNRKRLVDRSAPACEFLCLKCLHLKSKNFLKYLIHKYGLKNKLPSQQLNFPTVTGFSRLWGGVTPPTPPYYLRACLFNTLKRDLIPKVSKKSAFSRNYLINTENELTPCN